MPLSQPTFPTQRAFVVQVHADANVAQGRVWGRVEHIVSGQAAYFQSMAELGTFMVQLLSSASEASGPLADGHDP
jgi:hypothetical protein